MAKSQLSVPMRLARIRVLSANQGDRVGKLKEMIEIAEGLLKELGGKTRKKTGGRDRMERDGHDRGES